MNRYKLCIKGKNPDYFLNKIIDKNINIYDVSKNSRELFIEVDSDGYDKICNIKTSYKISVVEVRGLLKIKYLINKYFFFVFFFCLGVLLNVFLSKIIFDIDVVHSNSYIRNIIYDDLEDFGIRRFKFKVSFDKKKEIISKILDKEKNDIEWLEIEEVGTKYIVKVEQRKLNDKKSECSNRNIVAKKNATILEIYADSGEVVKKKLDYVLKDDVIISGVIHNKEDVVSNKCAEGRVYGEVWYKVNVELPVNYYDVKNTGKNSYRIGFYFLNKEFVLFNNYETYNKKDIINLGNKLLPIGINFSKYYETSETRKKFNLNNCLDKVYEIAIEKLKLKISKDDVILSKKVLKKELKNSKIIVEVFFKVKEDITSFKDIVIDEAKREGD